jgi:hypothetical protein
MGFFDWLSGSSGKTDRYGNDRESGRGPRVKSGPTGGLLRARNKDGRWGASKKRK